MTKQNEYAKALKKLAEEFDAQHGRDFSSLLDENFKYGQHIMLIEEKEIVFAQSQFAKLEKEMALLEKVDLIDYWNMENGRTNKTR